MTECSLNILDLSAERRNSHIRPCGAGLRCPKTGPSPSPPGRHPSARRTRFERSRRGPERADPRVGRQQWSTSVDKVEIMSESGPLGRIQMLMDVSFGVGLIRAGISCPRSVKPSGSDPDDLKRLRGFRERTCRAGWRTPWRTSSRSKVSNAT